MTAKVLFISDLEHSALSTAARTRAEILGAEVIYALDFSAPSKLLNLILHKNPETVIFSWRQSLIDILDTASPEPVHSLRREINIAVLIPDHLGLEPENHIKEVDLLNFVDYYLVTSELLFNLYSQFSDIPKPRGILHDLPNVSLINCMASETLQEISRDVIWVGNSKWGKRQGFSDHKGFLKVVEPLINIVQEHNNCITISVVDSSKERKTNEQTLRLIRSSKFLLLTSRSEGTGLPILEALGLGVSPLTTEVGIAGEVLNSRKNLIIAPPDPYLIHDLIHAEMLNPTMTRQECIDTFERYIERISSEKLPTTSDEKSYVRTWGRKGLLLRITTLLKWRIRWAKRALSVPFWLKK
jgi:glycosyltransferase involved in cell wall biosynthesis